VNIYQAKHYREYITAKINNFAKVRGYRTKLAKAAGFSPSFLSQVMHESVEITPEHAIRMAQFWEMDDQTTEYWMQLVDHGRAGSIILRRHIEHRMVRMATVQGYDSAFGNSQQSSFAQQA
jgi:plasmid maintenance system antidote protein VapI